MFHICALKNILYYVTNQQIHFSELCFTIYYYTPTRSGHFCDQHQGVIQEYKQLHEMYN